VKERKQAALVQFDLAERLRAALMRKPESRRTRTEYEKAMEAYRKVYHTAPNSIRADVSILTVAELLDEQGRVLHDAKSYGDAIGQLVFLRREYPGSKYRVAALFTIGEIYRDDLRDPVQAKATFEDYLKHYPNSSLAGDAREVLAEMASAETRDPFKKKSPRPARDVTVKAVWLNCRRHAAKPPPNLRKQRAHRPTVTPAYPARPATRVLGKKRRRRRPLSLRPRPRTTSIPMPPPSRRSPWIRPLTRSRLSNRDESRT
jgi:N-acetylmuramoyl-L-alanine amidase